MKGPTSIHCKRAYEPPQQRDGCRVLVDRLWPRGLKREDLHLDMWCKELAPSDELRRWFNHDSRLWAAFYQRYHKELRGKQEELQALLEAADGRPLTLLYAARDSEHNNAVALAMFLRKVMG
ncbi:DUF488 domain-containing protein [Microbulbifer thermotolerans]|uniref:DUF488 domain-containing protein n=1 Tax=Microbulbifer thermotolerans TaxID=252514 RepID=UPI00094343C6|nr:DUF488 domain-containing protein [Microbulbifer thermotolerans]MCX2783636.1 DUF488 domain-containing protein [Microbulbifer thermotolerans]MCX2796233.1 DUF488 domain-containing protein [Microbulbifer thermotolerans]MCX2832942.1 DUF488 domain-containing protein [Microbulbifer thermotolerans]MCX2836176.1 DUF488 domain-containing protein [Microbulbifer thermotolerans]